MQTKYGQYGVYRNKPKKMRQFLAPKPPPSIRYISKQAQVKPKPRSLEKDQLCQNSLQKQVKQSLAQLVATTRKRVVTERSQRAEKQLNLSINFKKLKKQSFRLVSKPNEQNKHRRTLIIKDMSERQSPPAKSSLNSNKKFEIPSSVTQRKKHQTLDFTADKVTPKFIPKLKPQRRQSEIMLNFRPKHRSLHKMSAQIIGQARGSKIASDFVQGFSREKKLGKGGFSVVWEAKHLQTGQKYAVKEIDAFNQYQTHLAQITFSCFFFENGAPKPQFTRHPGIDGLLTLHGYHLARDKVYIIYEKCTASLGEFLFDIYEETEPRRNKGQKSFVIMHKALYKEMQKSCDFLKGLLYQMAASLELLSRCNIVHSDIKTSNILINVSKQKLYTFKLIDYGSSFFYQSLHQYRLATPEYIPPQLLNFLNFQKGKSYDKDILKHTDDYENISAIDMWGLGCIMLEIIHGVPLWLNNQVAIRNENGQKVTKGLFATNQRAYDKILAKQIALLQDFDGFLEKENNTNVLLDRQLKKILKGMLKMNPDERMRPRQVMDVLNGDIY